MRRIFVCFLMLLVPASVFASVCFGVKMDTYGGSIYIASKGQTGKTFVGIGQFRDKLKYEFGAEFTDGLGLKLFWVPADSYYPYFNPYLTYDELNLGFYTRFSRYGLTDLYANYGIDFEYKLDVLVENNITRIH